MIAFHLVLYLLIILVATFMALYFRNNLEKTNTDVCEDKVGAARKDCLENANNSYLKFVTVFASLDLVTGLLQGFILIKLNIVKEEEEEEVKVLKSVVTDRHQPKKIAYGTEDSLDVDEKAEDLTAAESIIMLDRT